MTKERLKLDARLDGSVWIAEYPSAMQRSHAHEELELNLVLSGKASYLLGRRRYELVPGSLAWLFPDQYHFLMDPSEEFRMWVVVFRPKMVSNTCSQDKQYRELCQPDPPGHYCRIARRSGIREMESLLQKLASAKSRPLEFNTGLAYFLCRSWNIYNEATKVKGASVHPAVEKAARIMREDSKAGNSDDIAREVHMSRSQLSRIFHRQTGLTLNRFRNIQRLERFFRVYENDENWNMLQAALEAGFGSYAQFHRVFKQETGCGPAEYFRKP